MGEGFYDYAVEDALWEMYDHMERYYQNLP